MRERRERGVEGGERGGRGVRERRERGEEREWRSHFARGRVGGRRGRSETTPLFPCVFLIPALRDSRAKIMRKKIFCGWCDMGKIRKNPNKIGVFGVKKKFAWGG